jgi:uncharacterized protein with PIN domain
MLVVDASALVEVLADGPGAESVRERLAGDPDHAALLTLDQRLAGAPGIGCPVDVP